jgi:hypothetical protein
MSRFNKISGSKNPQYMQDAQLTGGQKNNKDSKVFVKFLQNEAFHAN